MTCTTQGKPRLTGFAMAGFLLTACGDKGVTYNVPDFNFRSRYQAAPQGAPVLLNNTNWWMRLKDPVLGT